MTILLPPPPTPRPDGGQCCQPSTLLPGSGRPMVRREEGGMCSEVKRNWGLEGQLRFRQRQQGREAAERAPVPVRRRRPERGG